jgi:hypothetical protein
MIATPIIVIARGFLGGLENPNLEEQNASSEHMRTGDRSNLTDLDLNFSMSPAQKESSSKDSSDTLLNPEARGVPIPGPSGSSSDKPPLEDYPYSVNPMAVGPICSHYSLIPTLTGSYSDQAPTSENNKNKQKNKKTKKKKNKKQKNKNKNKKQTKTKRQSQKKQTKKNKQKTKNKKSKVQ